MTKLSNLLGIFFCCFLLFYSQKIVCNPTCNPVCQPNDEYEHWFTGPIFTPNPKELPPFHPGLEVVLISSCTYGIYDHKWKLQNIPKIWSIGPYIDFQYSFNEIIGIEYIGSMTSNFSHGATSTHLRDSIFRLGFQISRDRAHSWIPDFRILLQETFPTGKYQKLDPRKKGTDLTGDGSFETGAHFAFQKLFHTGGGHCLSIRGDIGYFFPSNVHVNGFNYYTENLNAHGKSMSGKYICCVFNLGVITCTEMEYSLREFLSVSRKRPFFRESYSYGCRKEIRHKNSCSRAICSGTRD